MALYVAFLLLRYAFHSAEEQLLRKPTGGRPFLSPTSRRNNGARDQPYGREPGVGGTEPQHSRRQWDAYWDLTKLKERGYVEEDDAQTPEQKKAIEERNKAEKEHFEIYEKDENDTNLYAMQLKVAEQAIYGIQARIEELEPIIEAEKDNPLMRIAYINKRLHTWILEMEDFYQYSHFKYKTNIWHDLALPWAKPFSPDNPWWFPNLRHIMYYQAILRRYINIIYSVETLKNLHLEVMEQADKINITEIQEQIKNMKNPNFLKEQLEGPPAPPGN